MEQIRAETVKIRELFITEISDKAPGYVNLLKTNGDDKNGLDSYKCATWLNVVIEINNALLDLLNRRPYAVYINQRRTYFSARFAMEGMADLVYINENPEEVKNVVTSEDFSERLLAIAPQVNPIKRDRAVADLLRNENRFSTTTLSRIDAAFPGVGLTQYAILCLFTHNNDLGNQFFARMTERDYLDLYYQIIRTIRIVVEKLIEYMTTDTRFGASEAGLTALARHLVTLERKIRSSIAPKR